MLVAVYLIGVVCLATPHQGTHTVHTNHHAFGKMWAPGHKKKSVRDSIFTMNSLRICSAGSLCMGMLLHHLTPCVGHCTVEECY